MIQVNKLCFSYTKAPFMEDISFSVADGEIFGFLGPSGAGKSTLQKILIGMLKRYTGSALVNGVEVKEAGRGFYENIGIAFEFPSLYEKLTGRQNLNFFASLYAGHKQDTAALLQSVGLLNDADRPVSDYSKGMKGRLNFIKALVHDPAILFLDEPTSGLDPTNSRIMKDLILAEKARGKTVILTTHNMYDATELCDRVAFIVDGQIRALDTPHQLIMQKSAARLEYTYLEQGVEKSGQCPMEKTAEDALLQTLIGQNRISTIHSREQTLGDVFMEVTGRRLT